MISNVYQYYSLLIFWSTVIFRSSPSPSVPVPITTPSFVCALIVLLPWLIVVFISVVDCCIYFRISFLFPLLFFSLSYPSLSVPVPITAPAFVRALVILLPWLIVVFLSVFHFYFLSISDCVPILGSSSTMKERKAVSRMDAHG